jgi:cystathionine beta-lyase
MHYDFDRVIDRHGTYAVKWSGVQLFGPNVHFNQDTIPMMIADMDLPCPQPVIDAMHRVADHGMYGYSSHICDPQYNTSLCRWFLDRHGWKIRPGEVLHSHGTFDALTHVALMKTRPGEGVILMNPVYGHFSQDVVKWGRQAVFCHLLSDNEGYYTIDYAKLEALAADPNNSLLIFCNPHNPVGRVWTAEEIAKVANICEKHSVFVISDEVHCDHLRAGVHFTPYLTACGDKGNAISLVGINKSFNMAGLSCSNAIVQDGALRREILRSYHPPMPTPFAIAGQIAAYTEGDEWMDQVCAYISGNIDWAIDFFRREMPKLKVRRPEGTYFLWLDFRGYGLSDEEIHRRIYIDANVMLQDGTVHDPEEGHCFQRMCVPCARSVLMTACQRIADAFRDLSATE